MPLFGFLNALQQAAELEKARLELQNTKRQCELVKSLLADATAEKEIMYEVGRAHHPDFIVLSNSLAGLQRRAGWHV